jgi:threonine aldolase
MVFFDVSGLGLDNAAFLMLLQDQGVKMGAAGHFLRAVTHLDVSSADIETAIGAIEKIAAQKRVVPQASQPVIGY